VDIHATSGVLPLCLLYAPGRNGTNSLESGSSESKRNSKAVYVVVTINVKSLPECATVDSAVYVTLKKIIIYEYSSKSLSVIVIWELTLNAF
jgi:hypothetical protein